MSNRNKKNKSLGGRDIAIAVLSAIGVLAIIIGLSLNTWKFAFDGSGESIYVGFFADWPDSLKLIYSSNGQTFVSAWSIAFEIVTLVVLILTVSSVLTNILSKNAEMTLRILNLLLAISFACLLVIGIAFCVANTFTTLLNTVFHVSWAIGAYFIVIGSLFAVLGANSLKR